MTEPLPLVPISYGELVDKITILETKLKHFKDASKRANTQTELGLLLETAQKNKIDLNHGLVKQLREVNQALWDIEDWIRIEEQKQDFGPRFIELARSVYFENDKRANYKKEINLLYGSRLIEEKEYVDYRSAAR